MKQDLTLEQLIEEEKALESKLKIVKRERKRKSADPKFIMLINTEMDIYLDWVTETYHMPKAMFIRELIDQSMSKNKEYITYNKATNN